MNIALVSITLNAVNPMTEYLREKAPESSVRNYLDSHLTAKIKAEGGITDASMRRMFHMLTTACEDGADGILLTCTVFSPYAQHFSALLSKPVICADRAMLEEVAAKEGRTAILCTFTGTVDPTRNLYYACRRALGREETVDMIVLPDAYEAAGRGDFETHDQLIAEKAQELDEAYDNLVLAQISMAGAAKRIRLNHSTLYTSPDSAYNALMRAVGR